MTQRRSQKRTHIAEVVLTGGSCAGKTLALTELGTELRRIGQRVITVPEVATMLITDKIPNIGEIARENGPAYCAFQHDVFRTIQVLRARARATAQSFGPGDTIIIYDRGELDGMAYHAHECFDALAEEYGTTIQGIRDGYDAVVHMVTAAEGAEVVYSNANNSARWDTVEEARHFDKKILTAWSGSKNHVVIDNRSDFPDKIERLVVALLQVLKTPGQLQIELPGMVPAQIWIEMDLEGDSLSPIAVPASTMES